MTKQNIHGFSMIEVLVTIVILMIGLLGLAGLQARALTSQMESYQRAQALVLLKDMAGRINANRLAASCYGMTSAQYLGTGSALPIPTVPACAATATTEYNNLHLTHNPPLTLLPSTATSAATTAVADMNEWHNALLGASEVSSVGTNVGAMIGARGCVFQVSAPALGVAGQYVVVVAWQGINVTAAPENTTATSPGKCGLGTYKDKDGNTIEALHRVLSLPINIATLD